MSRKCEVMHDQVTNNNQLNQQPTKPQPTHHFTPQYIHEEQHAPVGQMVQVPEYSIEQELMQSHIRQDTYGLLKRREQLKKVTLIMLLLALVFTLFNCATLAQLGMLKTVNGASVRRFGTTEMTIILAIYAIFCMIGILSVFYLGKLMVKVNKIRVLSVPNFGALIQKSLLCQTLLTSGFFFFSAFWLMTSPSSYWVFFIFQSGLALISYIAIFLMVYHGERLMSTTQKEGVLRDEKPRDEIDFYKPIGYKMVVKQPNAEM